MSKLLLEEQASPSTPAANKIAIYAKAGGGIYKMDDLGAEVELAASGSVVDTSGTPVSNDIARFTDADTIEGRSYTELKADLNLEIGTDILAQQTIGIANDNLVEMDSADAASGEIARFTANGLESRSDAEMKTQLGYLTDVVDDTTPQLGGDLDTNEKDILIDDGHGIQDESGNEQLTFSTTASAVNEITIKNAATGNGPEIQATGGDTNIDIELVPKGTGGVQLADALLKRPKLIDYGETVNALGDLGGGTDDIDLEDGNVVTATVSTGEQTFTFSNPSASGTACSFTLILTNGGSQTVNWPASVDWAGGTAPSLTSSGVDILTFTTVDGGTTWYGFAAGLAMA